MFRRRFVKLTAVFLAGSIAFPYVSQIYPPLDLDQMLIFFGVIFFIALAIAIILERRSRKHQELEVLKRIYRGFILLPCILAATLLVNGWLDSQKNATNHPAVVYGRYNMPPILRGRRLYVKSWRSGQKYEGLAVSEYDYDRFKPGDQVNVGVKPGALGIPWYYDIYRR